MIKFRQECDSIVFTNLVIIEYFPDIQHFLPLADKLCDDINIIFDKLLTLEKGIVFNNADMKIVMRIINNEIWRINDTLYQLNSEELANNVYDVIENIFEQIIESAVSYEQYEAAENFKKVRENWFKKTNLKKIINLGEQG